MQTTCYPLDSDLSNGSLFCSTCAVVDRVTSIYIIYGIWILTLLQCNTNTVMYIVLCM